MASIFPIIRRGISTTAVASGKKNFRKFNLYNKRGTREFKERQRHNPDPDIPIHDRGTRKIGFKEGAHFVVVPEMVPELIVPNLEDCQLKPYVSYRSTRVVQSAFTPKDLFDAIYAKKITSDFREGKLDETGNPLEPSEFESLSPQQALDLASKTGSDLFAQEKPPELLEEVK
ncbi:39S ribosomal protein L41, mitochondrial [Diachasma alloeum]|uniref:39S ribosomal protein L41, mitochondrial n=1 Tax=Diachasma alloeum TaxID=454923 RepID=UPI0007381857|nr:39S ribosomal protein L41, mitochondrial [Diachasma alloeum]XP_015111095.1 39S ribosomal protein L41, mitochondrial [Diachasma alloeum]